MLPNEGGEGLLAAPNEGAGAGVLAFPPPPNEKGLLLVAAGAAPPPKLKLGAGVGVAFPPNLKPVDAG